MAQNAWSVDEEGIQLTYSSLPHTPLATPPPFSEPVQGESEPVRASRSA
jgi:hypothetical protein